ncbi:gamma carbonic anhydrase family protein [Actinomadura adrarensis]|uniref:Gamma carbonic anhydrase family protein n=1 Tax=Actinomadura adrarensis TaxID=1819600 RepID=A0ABW3CSS8_9ACTN
MPIFSFEGKSPTVHPDAFIAPTATLVGDVIVEAGASVWYNAVIRADYEQVIIRAGANVQDGAVLHAPPGMPCIVGEGATIAHSCVVHGAVIGREAMVANHSTVLDGAKVGARTMVAAHSLVVGGTEFPDEVVVVGSPAKVKGPIAGTGAEFWVNVNPGGYQELAGRHKADVALVEDASGDA